MKKQTLFSVLFIALSVILPLQMFAQNSATGRINHTAVVYGDNSVTGFQDLNFGVIIPGETHSVYTNDPNAGIFEITKYGGGSVILSWSLSPLQHESGNGPTINISNGLKTAISDSPFTDFEGYSDGTYTNGESINLETYGNADGHIYTLYVFMGSTINVPTNVQPGTYTGLADLTVEFN